MGAINDRLKRHGQPATPRLSTPGRTGAVDTGLALELAALVRGDGTPLVTISCHGDIGVLKIGRGDEADLVIADDTVSKLHAEFCWDERSKTHVVTDCNSTNGTFVNRKRIAGPVSLLNGTRIHFGKISLTYRRPYHGEW
jgi:pSer/pThr/pTyr-binding forkhead associated (FHA) protein